MPNKTLTGPRGFRVAAVSAGIKQSGALDLGLIAADALCAAAAVFTTNRIVGPAVTVTRRHLRSGRAQAVYVNAGSANVCTGKRGERDVHTICRQAAARLDIEPSDVLVCSTGIIGRFLPMAKVRAGIDHAVEKLSVSARAGTDLAKAIMTTDTRQKTAYRQVKLAGRSAQIAGIAKGSGMIAPNMATMLAFITTDADITPPLLRRALKNAEAVTFNKVTVDNHMSPSDTAIVLASGRAANKLINKPGGDYEKFARALWAVCDDLARQMAADGEGATRMITVRVTGAATQKDATKAVRAIVDSPLVRTAFYGADPNWGRIVSAVGYSGARFAEGAMTCKIAGRTVYRNGQPSNFDPAQLSSKMKAKQWTVELDLAVGRCSDFCYTCDLTGQYVTINADYHT